MYYTEPEFHSFDGTRLYVRESGKGPLLLLIHGGATDCDFFKSAGEILSQWFHVISYDRRNHVRSGSGRTDDKMDIHAEDASALIKHFSEDNTAFVVGHSLGGIVGIRLAVNHPEQIKKMLLHEPAFDFSRIPKEKSIKALLHPILFRDDRGRSATPEESANVKPDTDVLIKYDLKALLKYRVPYKQLKGLPIVFAVGEKDEYTMIYHETVRTAAKLDAQLFYFPGAHNSGFNLPMEWSYLTAGIFLSDK